MRIGPTIQLPDPPTIADEDIRDVQDTPELRRSFRRLYDWKRYTRAGQVAMESYWDHFVDVIAHMLPARFTSSPRDHRGINLGTFNGTFQKAWMRRGHPMYGVDFSNIIDELHEYGCEGHQDNVFDLSSIDAHEFDFAVLDRVIGTKAFHDFYCDRPDSGAPVVTEWQGKELRVPPFFASVTRILKPCGVFVGILYGFYTAEMVAELASLGQLALWPVGRNLLGFSVERSTEPTELPPIPEDMIASPLFRRVTRTPEGLAGLYLPTNEVVVDTTSGQTVVFGPESPHYKALTR